MTNGRYRVTDASSAGGVGNLGSGTFTLDGGTFAYAGPSDGTSKEIGLTANGGTIEIESATTRCRPNGAIIGAGGLTKAGPGTLALANASNSFTSLTVAGGAGRSPVRRGPRSRSGHRRRRWARSFTPPRARRPANFNLVFGAPGFRPDKH